MFFVRILEKQSVRHYQQIFLLQKLIQKYGEHCIFDTLKFENSSRNFEEIIIRYIEVFLTWIIKILIVHT